MLHCSLLQIRPFLLGEVKDTAHAPLVGAIFNAVRAKSTGMSLLLVLHRIGCSAILGSCADSG